MKLSTLYSREWITVTVTGVLALILIALFLPRAVEQVDVMEQRRFDLRLTELNAGLRLRSLELITRNQTSKIVEGVNPFLWLDYADLGDNIAVVRYLGEVSVADVSEAEGMWIYDPDFRAIGYLPSIELRFQDQVFVAGEWVWFQVRRSNTAGADIWKLIHVEIETGS